MEKIIIAFCLIATGSSFLCWMRILEVLKLLDIQVEINNGLCKRLRELENDNR